MGHSQDNSSHSSINKTSLIDAYQSSIDSGDIRLDIEQREVIKELQTIYNQIVTRSIKVEEKKSFFSSLFGRNEHKTKNQIKGLYLHGGVGRGKTHLVDFFYNHLPIEKKLRLHFHRFMQLVHEELAKLDGVEDPLKAVADSFSKKATVLCFDEFHVIDITDAMLLGRLLEYLFADGMVLVTTSNFHPDELYKNGLQRERFIPAINLLKKHTHLLEMGGDYDYRTEAFKELGVYYFIHDSSNNSNTKLEEYFKTLSGIELYKGRREVIINGRTIPVKKFNAGLVWFEFDDLCNAPRSTEDFNQIASFFKTVLISNIPVIDASLDDAGRRFINMIDTFYDMHLNVVVSASTKPEDIYTGKKLAFEFDRAVSRINEMQTTKYIKQTHQLDNDN